ncbi:MAG: hypothetical protein ACYCTY_09830, partial [Sulfuricella sp.]
SKSVPERVLQTQHQEKTIEGRLGRQLPLQHIVCINVLMRLPCGITHQAQPYAAEIGYFFQLVGYRPSDRHLDRI